MPHPVLDTQMAIEGGGPVTGPPPEEGSMTYDSEWVNKQVPNIVAAMAVGSILTLVILRAAGFRFSFGVNVGGGS
jgi:hypothetical protein